MANRRGKSGSSDRFSFLALLQTVTAAMKCQAFLGKKAVANLDSILKSKDITLPTKVHIVKAMFFPEVMNRCDSWTITKAEPWRIGAVVFKKTLVSPLDCKEIKSVNPKGNQLWIFIGRTDAELKLQYFGHLMGRANSLENSLMLGKIEGTRRRGQQKMRWLESITDSMDTNLSKVRETVGQGSMATTVHGSNKESNTIAKSRTQLISWTTTDIGYGSDVWWY